MNVRIEALDTLFFRNGKPFTMGQDNSIESYVYPPSPSVLYGALRSSFITQNIEAKTLESLIEETESLKLKNIYIKQYKNGLYSKSLYPLPKDLVVPEYIKPKRKNNRLSVVGLKEAFVEFSNTENISPLLSPLGVEKTQEGNFYISDNQLESYFDGKSEGLTAFDLSKYLSQEVKTGIAIRSDTGIVNDGMLYKVSMIRPSVITPKGDLIELSICIEGQGIKGFECNSLGQLGGERKAVSFLDEVAIDLESADITEDEFKIYLATPAIFEAGWYPKTFLNSFNLEITSAAIGKPVHIGGWDVKLGKPKPMLKAVDAGAVYYLRAKKKLT